MEKDEQLLGAKESLKTIAARAIEAFQTIDEYNTVLFSWYFKGFELLRRYLVKHPSSVDFEEVDQEMAADEATHLLPQKPMPPRVPLPMKPLRVLRLVTPVLMTTSLLMLEPGP